MRKCKMHSHACNGRIISALRTLKSQFKWNICESVCVSVCMHNLMQTHPEWDAHHRGGCLLHSPGLWPGDSASLNWIWRCNAATLSGVGQSGRLQFKYSLIYIYSVAFGAQFHLATTRHTVTLRPSYRHPHMSGHTYRT